jgi:HEAT repeat protein
MGRSERQGGADRLRNRGLTRSYFRLGRWKSQGKVDLLTAVARDVKGSWWARFFAVRALRGIPDRRAIAASRRVLLDPKADPLVRDAAATTLGTIGGTQDLAVLVKALDDDDTRLGAIKGLRALNDPRAIPALVRTAGEAAERAKRAGAKHSWETGRPEAEHSWATVALLDLGATEGPAYLRPFLDSPWRWQRRWAARLLADVGIAEDVDALRRARRRDVLHRHVYTAAIARLRDKRPLIT